MRSRAEIVFRWAAAIGALLTLVALALAAAGVTAATWAMLGLVYATGVSYGFSEMFRLFERHKRRCRECMEGTGRRIHWWGIRVFLVMLVAFLPVVLLLPLASDLNG